MSAWFSTSAIVRVLPQKSTASRAEALSESDFFQLRSEALSSLYSLIGKEVSGVKIASDGAIAIQIEDKILSADRDQDEMEVIWSLTSDTPAPFVSHDWSITLNDQNELTVVRP